MNRWLRFRALASSWTGRLGWLRSWGLGAVCLFGVVIYARTIWDIYPPSDWLLTQIGTVAGWCVYLHLGCVLAGHTLLARLLPQAELHWSERLLFSMAVGLVVFVLAMYLGGALAWYSSTWALLLPLLMMGSALPDAVVKIRRGYRPGRPVVPERPLLFWVAVALSAICLAALYLQVLPPSALNYDSRWYHLTVGEDYAREGRIVPFLADYNKAAFPQLTGFVYAWGSMLPGLDTPLRIMFILHNEFFMVLWTLLGVVAGARWLLNDQSVPGLFAVFFLFPGIFVYDSNIGGSADHVLGFFAIPIFLAAMRVSERMDPRFATLLGIVTGGAVLTKYQCVYMIIGVTPVVAGRMLYLLVRERKSVRHLLWLSPLAIIVTTLLVSSPHFIKNWVFYGNPIYPYFTDLISSSHPVQPETAVTVANLWMERSLRPSGTLSERLTDILSLLGTFSFKPHYSVDRPVFGSLFTLLLPALLFVKPKKRLFLGSVVACSALSFWASSYLVDRYIQTFMAMMVAVTAALLVRVWESGLVARLSLSLLVLTQIAWGADALVYSGHGRINEAIAMMRGGFEGRAKNRLDGFVSETRQIDKKLPKNAVLLFHNTRLSLGVNRPVYQDLPGFQSLISYRNVHTARELLELYRSFGITHVVHERGRWKAFTRQEEVVFSAFVLHYAQNRFRAGHYEVIELPQELPPAELPYRVLSFGLPGYENGIYPVGAMSTIEPLVPEFRTYNKPELAFSPENAVSHLSEVDAVIVWPGLKLPPEFERERRQWFTQVFNFQDQVAIFFRKTKRQDRELPAAN